MAEAPVPVRKSEHFHGMQVLRGIAALIVMIDHAGQVARSGLRGTHGLERLNHGAFGVDLFFPISGFVILVSASSLLRRHHEAVVACKEFARRRLIRVVPVYWISTTVKLATLFAVPAVVTHYRFAWWNAISSYLFIFSYNQSHAPRPVLPIGWTLNYEVFFYLLVAVALLLRLRVVLWTAGIIVLLSLASFFVPHTSALVAYTDPIQLEFVAGMLLASMLPKLRRIPATLLGVITAASLYFVFFYLGFEMEAMPARCVMWGIPGALILMCVLAAEDRIPFHRMRSLMFLGDASYSLYMTHTITLAAVIPLWHMAHLNGQRSAIAFMVVGCVVSLVVGSLFHLYCELPILRWFQGRTVAWDARSAMPAAAK